MKERRSNRVRDGPLQGVIKMKKMDRNACDAVPIDSLRTGTGTGIR